MDNTNCFTDFIYTNGPGILLALVVLVAGLVLIKYFIRLMKKRLEKREVEPSLIDFLSSITRVILTVLLLLSVARMLGLAPASFLALLGAAGLALGLALPGRLSDFSGGVLLLLLARPRVV